MSAAYVELTTLAVRAAGLLDRAGGRRSTRSRSSSSSSRSGSTITRTTSFGSSRGSSSIGAAIGGLVVLAVVGVLLFFVWQRFKSKSGLGAAGAAAGGAALFAAGAKFLNDQRNQEHATQGGGDAAGGIEAIRTRDPQFDEHAFLAGVEKSFFVIQKSWVDQTPELSRQVMADGLWQQHRTQIDSMVSNGRRNHVEDLAINRAHILRASTGPEKEYVTVHIEALSRDYEVDAATGKHRDGSKDLNEWAEDWTFERSATATTKAGEGMLHNKCSHCGAPLAVDLAGSCKYCKTHIMGGEEDWVLTRIDDAT